MSAEPALPDFVDDLLIKIAATEGFSKFTIESKWSSNHDDGFLSALSSVTITGIREINGIQTEGEFKLVCKLLPQNPTRRREHNVDQFFEREAVMYNKVLPMITKFQRDKGLAEDDCFVSYPKCYAAVADAKTDQFAIIMEDLKANGFVMWPKRQPAPPDHLKRILEELAKLHAVSFALKDQKPEIYEELQKFNDLFGPSLDKGLKIMIKDACARAVDVLEKEEHIEILKKLETDPSGYYKNSATVQGFGVLGHGDCWINNMMFKYKPGVSRVPLVK